MVLIQVVMHRTEDVRTRYLARQGQSRTSLSASLSLFLCECGFRGKDASFQTFLGLLSAGIAIALRDIIANAAGWLSLSGSNLSKRATGYRLAASRAMWSISAFFHVTIMEIGNWVDARSEHRAGDPHTNSHLFTEALANYSKGFQFIWNEIPVLVHIRERLEKGQGNTAKYCRHPCRKHVQACRRRHVKEASRRFSSTIRS